MKKRIIVLWTILFCILAVSLLGCDGMNQEKPVDVIGSEEKEEQEVKRVYYNSFDDNRELELVWSDEFDSKRLDTSKWDYDEGKDLWGNNELEYYTTNGNLKVQDGNLIITAKNKYLGQDVYTSARIKSKGKAAFCQGRIEAKMKLPVGQGLWPAFWMMGEEQSWPRCGEIDIIEAINQGDTGYGSIHWGIPSDREDVINGAETQSFSGQCRLHNPEEWHIYAIEWDKKEIRWYIDDYCYSKFEYDTEQTGQDAFQKPFYLLFNVAIGGDFPGEPDNSIFPQSMYVDYVRVYQSK